MLTHARIILLKLVELHQIKNMLTHARRLGYTREQMCGHGFRAMARTILDEVLGYPIEIIEMQLAHAVKDANGRAYNRTKYREQRHKMMQHWSDYLDGLQANNVVPVCFGSKAS